MSNSAQIQHEAEAQRAALSSTLGQLRDGMTTSALSAELVGVLRDSSLSLVRSLAESARGNPGAALLIGAGLTMMLTRTTGADVMSTAASALKSATSAGADAAMAAAGSARAVAGSAADKAKSLAGQATGTVAGMTDKVSGFVSDAASALKDQAAGTAESLRGKAGDQVDHARQILEDGKHTAEHLNEDASRLAADTKQSLSRLVEEQPILVAAIGTALGALLGAALPVSQAERQVLGKVGAEAVDKGRNVLEAAKAAAGEQLADAHLGDKVGDVAGKLVDSMIPAARSHSG